jgi:hypothetical protein
MVDEGSIIVKTGNRASHRFSLTFGMRPTGTDEAAGVIHYGLSREGFCQNTPGLNRLFRLREDPLPLRWDDVWLDEEEQWLRDRWAGPS